MVGMTVAIRVDASLQIGTGHVMRCLSLADRLHAIGAKCYFICREHAGNLIDQIRQRGFTVIILPLSAKAVVAGSLEFESSSKSQSWLGAHWIDDAEQTRIGLGSIIVDWLIIDHYAIDSRWEKSLRQMCQKLMVIDDLADRLHDCDLLLDQNLGRNIGDYSKLVPKKCVVLVGPYYALLRPEYASYRKVKNIRKKIVKTALIFFGGNDLQNITGMTLKALTQPELKFLELDVVIGANNPHINTLMTQVMGRPLTRIHQPRLHLADLMARADIFIGAGGATTWERMCMGLPSVVICVAENQRILSEKLSNDGLIKYAGEANTLNYMALAEIVSELITRSEQMFSLSVKTQQLVDGLGTFRVANTVNFLSCNHF
jgi:UDP-2,4-diacetamido-2,4,6-trideoxy-beta-L-altropyranose hydrolase